MPAAVEEANNNNANVNSTENASDASKNTSERNDRNEQMWKVLKAHILRERARKKQEREAEVEEERLRKEREAREQQDVMTLGETREQISQLETKLQQFKEEKHQLFLQLKKVLNEDDNRRRQLVKETTVQMLSNAVHEQTLYIQQLQQTMSQQPPAPQQPPVAYKTALKRPRSPSPQPQVPVSLYHQGYATYKPPTVPSYQGSPQKTPQYSSQPSAFYPVAPQELSIYYPLSRETARNVYENQRAQPFQMDHKIPEHYSTLRTTTSTHSHVIHQAPGLPINPQTQQPPKGGSITAGYPVRSQPQYQQGPAPASLYTNQARQMYQNPGGSLNYPPRE
ncbi:G protein pathway suppressor 2 isoform X2 [Cylas formicarius]|uniref:G protein pathway suppressor 2 isoform X2 n=1 Tax=Cylas formicarius TaxID=197179 RepID=UPI002958632C|nr:G protein pathway suppressor 2 isoform X2 [Cylas formicarius]